MFWYLMESADIGRTDYQRLAGLGVGMSCYYKL